jgi:hypothetical protein
MFLFAPFPDCMSCKVLVLAIFFKKSSSTPGIDAAGLISAVAGLVLFLEGLRVAIMPMALLVGNQLPLKLKLPWVLLVAFCLGVVSLQDSSSCMASCLGVAHAAAKHERVAPAKRCHGPAAVVRCVVAAADNQVKAALGAGGGNKSRRGERDSSCSNSNSGSLKCVAAGAAAGSATAGVCSSSSSVSLQRKLPRMLVAAFCLGSVSKEQAKQQPRLNSKFNCQT